MEKVILNDSVIALDDEVIIDVFTKGLGVYCGSFTILKSDRKNSLKSLQTESRVFYVRQKPNGKH